MIDLDGALDRINYRGPRAPSAETLRALHRAYMLAVPFENLDIGLGRPIRLDLPALFDKIVARRRGGFCYELNGLFAQVLRGLGFDVTLLSARVWGSGGWGPEFDHMALLVRLDEFWLADVGFGDSFTEPLPLSAGDEQRQGSSAYRLLPPEDGRWVLQTQAGGGEWQNSYNFTLQPRAMDDYAAMCVHQQTSPDSHFTQQRICSRAAPDGRISLSERRLIVTRHGQRDEADLPDEQAWAAALRQHFGIAL